MAPLQVPRKTPWSTHAEFQLVFDRLFNSDGDPVLQRDAISRIYVWLDRGHCPHAVESTANLVALVLQDSAPSTSHNLQRSPGDVRLSYAMAIVRFVNSLVDPLQTAYFARSIASLAAQINLPLYFVELRHQATHEDLPRLSVLRDAARQALDWLYTHYWLPALHAFSSSSSPLALDPLLARLPPLPLSTLRPVLLTTYKNLLKSSTRDASLAGRLRADVTKCYKDVERWVAENSLGGGPRGGATREGADRAERARDRALGGIAEVLWSEGGLVPLAKKKRPTPRSPALPSDLLAVWTPLLTHLDHLYDGSFTPILIRHALDLLTGPASHELERTYVASVVAWLTELLKETPVEPAASGALDENGDEVEEEEDPNASIKGVVKTCLLARTAPACALLDALFQTHSSSSADGADDAQDPRRTALLALQTRVAPLLQLAKAHLGGADFGPSLDAASAQSRLDVLDAQLDALATTPIVVDAPTPASDSDPMPKRSSTSSTTMSDGAEAGAGASWPPRVVGWKPRPVGFLPPGRGGGDGVLALDLAPPAATASA